ncbi:sensor histidine kinase [Kribbella sp. NPDC004875]|uniref:sensor histidine kinase n=1 Tax=Kribbella sp. NPDC004875 TaxID=3364107 RepID=UPI003695BEBB
MSLVLTPTARRLAWCLHLLVVALLALTALRAVADDSPHAGLVVAAAAICAVIYAAGPALPGVRRSQRNALVWLSVLGAAWLVVLVLSADGVWLAFPLYFLELHLAPRRTGLMAVVVTAIVAIVAFAAHQGSFSVAIAVGPALGAAVAVAVVWGYQALYRESEKRRRLIEELTATRSDLATAQHAAGVAAERERLAREIHDTLAQGLSSIQLLLRAAGRSLPDDPQTTAECVEQARQTAADNLVEARRLVAALTPPALEGASLAGALERLCTTTSARDRITARFQLKGSADPLPTSGEVALLRVAQSALANVVQHAEATTAEVTLDYSGDHVVVSITDDGCGFDPDQLPDRKPDGGGFGLSAMRSRLEELGGTLSIRSAPGTGTTVVAELRIDRTAEAGL